MKYQHAIQRLFVACLSSLLLTLGLLVGLAIAGDVETGQPVPSKQFQIETQTYWLVLDTSLDTEATLPHLRHVLTQLESNGIIESFDPEPPASAPDAVPAVRVVVDLERSAGLARLPGVLAVATELPPPPPDDLGVLATSGTITGQLTDAGSGQPIASEDVTMYDAVSFNFLNSTTTDSSGNYSVMGTAPYSQAKIYFGDDPGDSAYITEWYNDKPYFSEAITLPLSGGTTPNIDGALARGGAISGTVTFDSGGPAANVFVDVWDSDEDFVGFDTTDGNGRFAVGGLVSGTYKVDFFGGQMVGVEWYQDQADFDTATPINVIQGMTATIMAQVPMGGIITGTLTDTMTLAPIQFERVYLIDDSTTPPRVIDSDSTDNNGLYQVTGLMTGTYKIGAALSPVDFGTAYEKQYYDGGSTLAGAMGIAITPGTIISNINIALNPVTTFGTITGTVTKNGAPLPSSDFVVVDIYDGEFSVASFGDVFSGDDFQTGYTINNVKPGQYRVEFNVFGSQFLEEYYDNKPNLDAADIVTVTAGMTTTNINADLTTGSTTGSISGTITSGGQPVEEAIAFAYKPDESGRSGSDFIFSFDNGMYTIDDLEPGTYLISFSSFPSATTWYNGQMSRAMAQTVTVMAGNTTPNIDGTLEMLGACISGKIVDGSGQGIEDAEFRVYDQNGNNRIYVWEGLFGTSFTRSPDSDEDGGYVACGLAPGTYTIEPRIGGSSGPITVAAGEVRSNVTITAIREAYLPIIIK